MKRLKRFFRSGTMVTLVWVLGIAAIWEGFAYYVAQTKRTPLNVLPHLWQIIGSFFSDITTLRVSSLSLRRNGRPRMSR